MFKLKLCLYWTRKIADCLKNCSHLWIINEKGLPILMQVACEVGSYVVNNEGHIILLCLLYLWWLNATEQSEALILIEQSHFIRWFGIHVCISDQTLQTCMQWSVDHSILELINLTALMLLSFRRINEECQLNSLYLWTAVGILLSSALITYKMWCIMIQYS